MNSVSVCAHNAKRAVPAVLALNEERKNALLSAIADALTASASVIRAANDVDLSNCAHKGVAFCDRLKLDDARIAACADGLRALTRLSDPIGKTLEARTLYNGLRLKRIAVPIGVVAVIYEARPNVTVDAAGICLKTSNVALLRGSRDALNTNRALVAVICDVLESFGIDRNAVTLVECEREQTAELLKDRKNIDLAIPRGSKSLIDFVRESAKVPVIETGAGNCSAYIDGTCDVDLATKAVLNAKTQRISVCNALESLYIEKSALVRSLPILKALVDAGVTVHGDKFVQKVFPQAVDADEDDFYREYLSMDISAKTVDGVEQAVLCVNKYGTHHSDAIFSQDKNAIEYFQKYVDSAAVYSNASTRFTDGGEFGMGAEIGISTQKLHARGPMGLNELTTYKYIIDGDGQIRE